MHDDDAPQAPESPGLDALAAQAADLENGALPPELRPLPPEKVKADAADELFGALLMARLVVAPMFVWWDEFEAVWTDKALQGIADGGAQVMERHGWTMDGAWTQFGPYIALAGATLPPALVTYRAIQARKAQAPATLHADDAEGVRP